MNQEKLLEIKGLKTRFKIGEQWATAVNGIDTPVDLPIEIYINLSHKKSL